MADNSPKITRSRVETKICFQMLEYLKRNGRLPTLLKLSPDAFKILTKEIHTRRITYMKIRLIETPEVDEEALVELDDLH